MQLEQTLNKSEVPHLPISGQNPKQNLNKEYLTFVIMRNFGGVNNKWIKLDAIPWYSI